MTEGILRMLRARERARSAPTFVEFDVAIRATLRVDVTDPDFLEHGPDDTPEDLARYLCDDFVTVAFMDADQAFPGQSEIVTEGPVLFRRRVDQEQR